MSMGTPTGTKAETLAGDLRALSSRSGFEETAKQGDAIFSPPCTGGLNRPTASDSCGHLVFKHRRSTGGKV